MEPERPDWGAAIAPALELIRRSQSLAPYWEDCIRQAFPDNRIFGRYHSEALQSLLLEKTKGNLRSQLPEYIARSDLITYDQSNITGTALWGRNTSSNGPYYENTADDPPSDIEGIISTPRRRVIRMDFTVSGIVTIRRVNLVWARGLGRWREDYTTSPHALRSTILDMAIDPPSQSYEDAIERGISAAIETLQGTQRAVELPPDPSIIVELGSAMMQPMQSEVDTNWGLPRLEERTSVVWYEADCTLDPQDSREFHLTARLRGWWWEKTETELPQIEITAVITV